MKAHQFCINNQSLCSVAKASFRHQHLAQPLPTVAKPPPLFIATQPPLAISTGARPDLRCHRRFSIRHPLTNQFSTSPSEEPVLSKHTSAASTAWQAHVFTPNGPQTGIPTSKCRHRFLGTFSRPNLCCDFSEERFFASQVLENSLKRSLNHAVSRFADFNESSPESRSSRRMLNQPPLALPAMLPPPPGMVNLPPPPRPAPPLLLLSVDPYTITAWLTLPSNKIIKADVIQRLRGVAQHYVDLTVESDAPAIQSLVSECMTADEFTCFVTTVGGLGIAPYVMIVHCLGPYTAGFGTTGQFQGKTFGFLRECVGAQLPPSSRSQPMD